MTLFRRSRGLVAGSATAAALALGVVVLALQFSSAASARSESSSCADAVTGAPTGPATVSAASTAYGRVLVVGSGDHAGCSLFDPVTSPTGTWYLVDPSRGLPATGQAHLQLETAPLGGGGSSKTVLAAVMNNDFSLFPDASFPVYTLSTDSGPTSACQGLCAL